MARSITRLEALSTTAERIVAQDSNRTALYLRNEDTAIIIRVGPSTVTASGTAATAGLAIGPGETLPFLSSPQGGAGGAEGEWYAIAESGTPNIGILEIVED